MKKIETIIVNVNDISQSWEISVKIDTCDLEADNTKWSVEIHLDKILSILRILWVWGA